MSFDLWEFTLGNLEAAGVIGGYVAISIIGVALITYATRGRTKGAGRLGPKWAQPIIGGLLGVIPGCGGTIVASSMYKNGKISFGGLFAAFITTLGEGSFVLLGASEEADVAANLTAFVIVNVVGLVAGILAGYVVDGLGVRVNLAETAEEKTEEDQGEASSSLVQSVLEKAGFYLIFAIVLFLAPGSIMALWGGGIDAIAELTVWCAVALSVLSIVYYLTGKYLDRDHDCSAKGTLKAVLEHSVFDVAMVVLYVFIGLFVANFIIDVMVGAEAFEAWMKSSAFVVVLIAALIGVTPGCGGMIAVAAAFVSIPGFPIAALIAAAIATSGDGIFPLIAQNKKDALFISIAGLAVALVVGYLTLVLGF